jgi:hypothetical protein
LIRASSFVDDDPKTWKAPSTLASDISAGKALWHGAPLTTPTTSGAKSIQAHCADCHSEDGRDLKYFNYSNNSIEARSVFHGLTAAQGDQIASYIRSLNVPNPGRPWNPPYQPGPGTDSQPVANWAAGAGLSAVLDNDAEMLSYLMPGGNTRGWAANAYLNPREIPISLQLPDWNSWLPPVHPMDAFGASFTGSVFNTMYSKIHGELEPNSPTAYSRALTDYKTWSAARATFQVPLEQTARWTPSLRQALYATAQWMIVKQWELNQEFGLEGMPNVPYGAKGNARAWYGGEPFWVSPIQLHMPAGPGIGNGSQVAYHYLANIWYQMQLILNDGNGGQVDHDPIDYGYVDGSIKDLSTVSGTAQSSLQIEWLVKSLQEFAQNGNGPEFGVNGFAPTPSLPALLVFGNWAPTWLGVSRATQLSVTTAYLRVWFAKVSSFTPQEYYQGVDGDGRPWASPSENPALDSLTSEFGGEVWTMLPRFRAMGVDPGLLSQIYAWAASVWPAGNWTLNRAATATCTSAGCS